MRKVMLLLTALLLFYAGYSIGPEPYAIKNVSVIPMNRELLMSDQTVLIENGKIKSSGFAKNIKIPAGYTIVDGRGKYLVPGLFDMHVHFYYEQGQHKNTSDLELKMMLANGVTTARIMAGHPAYLVAKNNVHTGSWDGPELFVASPQLVGRWLWPDDFKNFELVDTKQKAIDAVKHYKREGYDEIKLTFMLKPDVYSAIIETAKSEGIKVTGHVGPFVKLPAALLARQQIEHMDEFIEMLLPDTSYNHGISVSDYSIYSPAAWKTVLHLDESKIPTLAKMVKDAGIYVTPTNYFFIHCFGLPVSDDEVKNMPDYNYVPAALKEEKWGHRTNYMKKMAPEEARRKYVAVRKAMVRGLWKAGVPLMAGSDTPEYFIVAGFTLHRELEMMVAAGLSPFAALQTATINPATYLGIQGRKGTIENGKDADLLLLEKNPLQDIRNTNTIIGVMKAGKWYDRMQVDRLLQQASELAK